MIRRIAYASCFLFAPFLAQAQTSGTCTAATLSGTYSLSLTGRNVTSAVALMADYQAVGTITFDGVSKATATLVSNTNKALGFAQTMAGTYAIKSNCLGTLNITGGDTATYTLIPYSNGNDYLITGSDATYILTGSGGPQPASCLTSTLSGVFAFSGNGFSLVSAGITAANDISGLLQFDGAGLVAGSWAVATNGASTPATVSGTYTLSAASCTGSATVKDANGVAYTLSYVMTTAEGSDFALVGASATEMFTSTAHATFGNPGLAVANAAGVSGGTPAGSLFSIYGSGFSTTNGQEVTAIWPTTLANASVTVNGEPAPLYYVSPTQINAQMPLDIAPGFATVIVKNGSTSTAVVSNSVAGTVPATANPGVLIYGSNRAVAQNLPSYTLNSTSAPAPSGSYIVVYFTGGGPVQGGSALITGHAAPSNVTFPLTETYSATIGGINAPIVFIGLAPGFVGLYQADIQIPTLATGSHNLILTVGGTASNTTAVSTN